MNKEQMRKAYLDLCEKGWNNSQDLFYSAYELGYQNALSANHIPSVGRIAHQVFVDNDMGNKILAKKLCDAMPKPILIKDAK